MRKTVENSLWTGILAGLISLPVLGIHIEQTAQGLMLRGQWEYSLYASVAVFFVRLLFLPLVEKMFAVVPRNTQIAQRFSNNQYWLFGLLILSGVILPFFSSRGVLNIATLTLIYIMLGLGLNIVVGYAGLLNLGYVGFYAIGAYTYAILQQYGIGFWVSLPIAMVLSGLMGIVLGFPVLRLRGDYLAIVTLGFGEIIRILLNNMDEYTNGPAGISSIPSPMLFNITFSRRAEAGQITFHELFGLKYSAEYRMIFVYFIIFSLCLLTLWVVNRLLRMPIGRAWEALREDELACRSLGINPTTVKLSAFAISAVFAGVAGVFFAAKQGFVNPESFTFFESATILAIVVLGGVGSQLGVILAAIALTVLPELAREFSQYRMLIFGAVMVLMMIWRPQGLIPAKRIKIELPQ